MKRKPEASASELGSATRQRRDGSSKSSLFLDHGVVGIESWST